MLNLKSYKIIGFLLLGLSLVMAVPLAFALVTSSGDAYGFWMAIGLSFLTFLIFYGLPAGKGGRIKASDGAFIVTASWLLISLFGGLPYFLNGLTGNLLDAFFESMSGFTTTGATVISDIESWPEPSLLWRSVTQWLGGMGILVLVIAVIPYFDLGGMSIYQAEAPGPTAQKLQPRIQDTAKNLWLIYVVVTLLLVFLLEWRGMSLFEAVNHALTTMATGGFSTKSDGMSHYQDGVIHWIVASFMIFASLNFCLHYYFFTRKFKFGIYLKDDEFRAYAAILLLAMALIVFSFSGRVLWGESELPLTEIFFNVASIISSSGHVLGDYEKWPALGQWVILLLMLVGGSAGSTSGGMKTIRALVIAKYIYHEMLRLRHPHMVKTIKINGEVMEKNAVSGIVGFVLIYILTFFVSVLLLSVETQDILTSVSAVISALSNIGPGFGQVGPTENYAGLGVISKSVLIVNMLMGRLELLTVIILFIPKK